MRVSIRLFVELILVTSLLHKLIAIHNCCVETAVETLMGVPLASCAGESVLPVGAFLKVHFVRC
jgi:hypothetical protein